MLLVGDPIVVTISSRCLLRNSFPGKEISRQVRYLAFFTSVISHLYGVKFIGMFTFSIFEGSECYRLIDATVE